jgi:uncharacterized damage-inducible protein DinB
MFRQVQDFTHAWEQERDMTLLIFRALTDESLAQRVSPEGRSLGRLAWHIAQSLGEMMRRTGLSPDGPAEDAPVPARAADIVAAFETAATSVLEQVRNRWTDETLLEVKDMYGEQWANGMTLAILIRHQAHHRGQMTVLMRQAGLAVPGIYGPAREEWAQWGMPAHE